MILPKKTIDFDFAIIFQYISYKEGVKYFIIDLNRIFSKGSRHPCMGQHSKLLHVVFEHICVPNLFHVTHPF